MATASKGTPNFDPAALRRLRRARRLSQDELAGRAGVPRTHVIRWERGAKPTEKAVAPLPANLVALAAALDVSPHELTTIDPDQASLRDLRTWAGLTATELAQRIGASRTTIHGYETGRSRPPQETACRLADALRVRVQAVYDAAERAKETSKPAQPSTRPG